MSETEEVTLGIKLAADSGPAKESAEDLKKYAETIEKAQEAIKAYGASLRALRGNSDAVIAARKELKALIDNERGAVSKANIEILKLGGQYSNLTKKAKESTQSSKDFASAIRQIGGPVSEATDKAKTFGEVIKTALTDPMVALGLAVAAGILSLVAFTAAIVTGTYEVAKFAVEHANLLRQFDLQREAFSGSKQNADAWGTQIEAIRNKLPLTIEQLNALAITTEKTFRGTKLSGQGMVDAFQLSAKATAALGDEASRTLTNILARGKQFGRVAISPFELRGAGLGAFKFEDISQALAKNLNVPVQQATRLLVSGYAKIDDVTKAMSDAVSKRFDGINSKKLLDLDVITKKFADNWTLLTKGFKDTALEGILSGLSQLSSLLDQNSSTGKAIQTEVTAFGQAVGVVAARYLPSLIMGIREGVLAGMRFLNWALEAAAALVSFGRSAGGMVAIKTVLYGIAGIAAVVVGVFALLGAAVAGVVILIGGIINAVADLYQTFRKIDWGSIGKNMLEGLANGIEQAWEGLKNSVVGVASKVKKTFENALGIQSPSKVFAKYGIYTGQGYAQGVEASQDEAQTAVAEMVETPKNNASQPQSVSTGNTLHGGVSIHFHLPAGTPQETVDRLQSQSVLEQLSYAVQAILRGESVPTSVPAVSGG